MIHTVVLIPGDGIGPEVSGAVRAVLEAADAPIRFVEHHAGVAATCSRRRHSTPSATTTSPSRDRARRRSARASARSTLRFERR